MNDNFNDPKQIISARIYSITDMRKFTLQLNVENKFCSNAGLNMDLLKEDSGFFDRGV